MRHRSIAMGMALLVAFVAASVAVAGGWAEVTTSSVPVDPPAGEQTTIELDVLQHGVTPVSWPRLTVVATDAASGTVVRAEAQAVEPEGSYVATLSFPSAGDWSLTFESPDLVMQGSAAISVAPSLAGAPAPDAAAEGSPVALAYWAVPLVLLLALLAIAGLVLRRRVGPGEVQVSART